MDDVKQVGNIYFSKFDDANSKGVRFQIRKKPYADAEYEYIPWEAWDSEFKQPATQLRKYFKDGSVISVSGELRAKKYADSEGRKKTKVYVQLKSWSFVPRDYSEESHVERTPDGNDEASSSDSFPF